MRSRIIAFVVGAVVVGALIWGFVEGRREQAAEAETEAQVETGERLGEVAGLPAIALDDKEQQASGIRVAPLEPMQHRGATNAVATVVSVTDLSNLHADLQSKQAQATAARAKAAASAAQVQRLRTLRTQEQDVSLTELQAAEATLVADQAAAQAAQASMVAASQSATLEWGPELARAIANDDALFQRLATGRDVLLQVTLPSGVESVSPPDSITVTTAQGAVEARYLSPATRSDARLQGSSFYYLAPRADLRAGTTAAASLSVGDAQAGAKVPAPAIVWWQGEAWIYTRHDATHFLRRQLPAGNAIAEGWFVPKGFGNDEPVVIAGAQLLLSEELRSQLQGDEE